MAGYVQTTLEGDTEMSKEAGKGGNFVSRPNPFGGQVQRKEVRPSYGSQTLVGAALDAVINAECALILGSTRDGGALVLTVLDGEERHRTYCSSDGELQAALQALIELYAL